MIATYIYKILNYVLLWNVSMSIVKWCDSAKRIKIYIGYLPLVDNTWWYKVVYSSDNNGYDLKLCAKQNSEDKAKDETTRNGTDMFSAYFKNKRCWPRANLNDSRTSSYQKKINASNYFSSTWISIPTPWHFTAKMMLFSTPLFS